MAEAEVNVHVQEERAPLGTVVTSLLSFDHFKRAVGDPANWNPVNSRWAPADGRQVVGSRYEALTGANVVPDLRGVFLRGLNSFDQEEITPIPPSQKNPEAKRVGEFQDDATPAHTHQLHGRNFKVSRYSENNETGYLPNLSTGTPNGKDTSLGVDLEDSAEVRPKNVSVYFYVKINRR